MITAPQIQKPGLALAGFFEYLHPGRVQILGRSEVEFLGRAHGGHSPPGRRPARLLRVPPASSSRAPCRRQGALLEECEKRRSIPLLAPTG